MAARTPLAVGHGIRARLKRRQPTRPPPFAPRWPYVLPQLSFGLLFFCRFVIWVARLSFPFGFVALIVNKSNKEGLNRLKKIGFKQIPILLRPAPAINAKASPLLVPDGCQLRLCLDLSSKNLVSFSSCIEDSRPGHYRSSTFAEVCGRIYRMFYTLMMICSR
uniref:Uncharacterized protein n=1 Tax=Leersia perrieri TaxID=77586 RepID=A0A0D9XER0_9ORYZ